MKGLLASRIVRRSLVFIGGALVLCLPGKAPSDTASQQSLSARDMNVWGRFGVGSWKQVRIVTETLNAKGQVVDTTTTETKTTLVRADLHRLALRIEVNVDTAGKRFEGQPQTVECGYYGEAANDSGEVRQVGTDRLVIDGRVVPCQVCQLVSNAGQQRQVTRLYLSDDVEPYVLKRETTVYKDDGKTPAAPQTTAEVIGLDLPYHILHGMKPVAFERTIQQTPKGANVSLDVTSVDVPGGIVARASNELDEKGHVVRRSMMELIDYQVVGDDNDDGNSSAANSNSPSMSRRNAQRARHSR